jgi:hypothetical protein
VGQTAHERRNKQIILVIDTTDQRDISTQQGAFLIAQEEAIRIHVVFVAIRPSMFFVSKTSRALLGYQTLLLTISLPTDEVIESNGFRRSDRRRQRRASGLTRYLSPLENYRSIFSGDLARHPHK